MHSFIWSTYCDSCVLAIARTHWRPKAASGLKGPCVVCKNHTLQSDWQSINKVHGQYYIPTICLSYFYKIMCLPIYSVLCCPMYLQLDIYYQFIIDNIFIECHFRYLSYKKHMIWRYYIDGARNVSLYCWYVEKKIIRVIILPVLVFFMLIVPHVIWSIWIVIYMDNTVTY